MAEETDFVDLSLGNNMPKKKKDKAAVKDQAADHSQTADYVQTLTIKVDKLQLLEGKMAKIAKTFGVQLDKEQRPMASTTGNVPDVQWIRIRGANQDCRDASMYVSNLCNPVLWQMIEYPPEISQLFDDDSCLDIERKSCAVLLNEEPGILVVHGRDELQVIMAVSIIEDIILKNVDSNSSASFAASNTDVLTTSLMDDMLRRAWADSDGRPESSELSLIPDEVKRAMLISMRDDDVEMDDSDSGCGSSVQASDADHAVDHAAVDPDVTVHAGSSLRLVDYSCDTVDAASHSEHSDQLEDVTLTAASSFVAADQCKMGTFSPLAASVSKFATALQQNEALSAGAPFRLGDQHKSNAVSDKSSPLARAISTIATASSPALATVDSQNAPLSVMPLFRHADQSQHVPFATSSSVASASLSIPDSIRSIPLPFPSKFGFQGGRDTAPFKIFDQSGDTTPLVSSTFVSSNHDMLKKLALQKNYSAGEIEQVLSRNDDWKESEFLRALHTNRRLQASSLGQSMQPSATDKTSLTVTDMQLQTFDGTITDLQQAESRQNACASPSVIICDPDQVRNSQTDKTSLTVTDMQLQTLNGTDTDLQQADGRQNAPCATPSVIKCDTDQVRCTMRGNGKRNSDELENEEFSLYCVVDDADEVDEVDDDNLIDLRDDDDQYDAIKPEWDNKDVDRTREVVFLREDHDLVAISSSSSDEIEEIYSSTGTKFKSSAMQKNSAGRSYRKKDNGDKAPYQNAKADSFLHAANASRMNEVDFISMIPSSSTPARNPVITSMPAVGGAGRDSLSTNLPSMKPVLGKKKRRKLAAQAALDRSRSPHKVNLTHGTGAQRKAADDLPSTSRQQAAAPVSLMNMETVRPITMQQQKIADLAAIVSEPPPANVPGDLRYIVIDGSNVAMSHGNSRYFSCKGIEIVINHFLERGHTKITALVPQWRRQRPPPEYPLADQHILERLKTEGRVVFTPARRLGNRNINCYDDRFMVELAIQTEGIVVTNDNYRDLYDEKSSFKNVIETRLLPYSFVGDIFMLPDDPLGRNGPRLDDFLRMPQRAPLLPPVYRPQQNQPFSTGNRFPYQQQQPQQNYWQQMYPTQRHQQHQQSLWPPPPQNAGYQQRSNFRPYNRPQQSNFQPNRWPNVPQNAGNAIRSSSLPLLPAPAGKSQPVRSQHQTQELRKQLLEVYPANQKEIDRVLMKHSTCNVELLCSFLLDELPPS